MLQVQANHDFQYIQEIRQRRVNVVEGLELHANILSPHEQRAVVQRVEQWVEMGRRVRCLLDASLPCLLHAECEQCVLLARHAACGCACYLCCILRAVRGEWFVMHKNNKNT